MPFMTVFDFGDTTQPLEQRESSIVATQALALMNNRFSHAQSRSLARRVAREAGADPAPRVDRLWRLAFGRAPEAPERDAALRHLRRIETAAAAEPAPVPAPRAPDALPGLRLWLRADRGVNRDEQGRVTGWSDLSGRGHDAAQTLPAARPELTADGPGGHPALRFDGRGRFLELKGQPVTSPGFTLLAIVTDRAGSGSHREIFSNWRREGNVGTSLFLGTTGSGAVRFSDHFAPAGILSRPERPLALTAVNGPAGASVYQDRRLLAERPSPLPERNLAPPYVIGQQGDIGGEYWTGEIAELVVFDRPLAAAELDAIWDYLSERYGVARRGEPEAPYDAALASLSHVILNSNEFLFVD
jgi:hypothetical protein